MTKPTIEQIREAQEAQRNAETERDALRNTPRMFVSHAKAGKDSRDEEIAALQAKLDEAVKFIQWVSDNVGFAHWRNMEGAAKDTLAKLKGETE